eukprot:SAG22_NODE_61_length_23387_cov_34.380582_10_plen_1134_part_00
MLSDELIGQKAQEHRTKFTEQVASIMADGSEPTDEAGLDDLMKKVAAASTACIAEAYTQLETNFGQKRQLFKVGQQIKLAIDKAQTSFEIEMKDKYHRFAKAGLETKLAMHKANHALQSLMHQGSEDYRVFKGHAQVLEKLGVAPDSDEARILAQAKEHIKAIKPTPCPNQGCPCICLARLLPEHERCCLFKLPLLTQAAVDRTSPLDCSGGFIMKVVAPAPDADLDQSQEQEPKPEPEPEQEAEAEAEPDQLTRTSSTDDELAAALAMSIEECKVDSALDQADPSEPSEAVRTLQDLTQATIGACNRALALADGDLEGACALILDGVVPADSDGHATDLLKQFEGTYVRGPCQHIDDDQPHWFHRLDNENQQIIRFKGTTPPSAFSSGKRGSNKAKDWVMTKWEGPNAEQVLLTGASAEMIDDANFDGLTMTPIPALSWAQWEFDCDGNSVKGALVPGSVTLIYFGGAWCPYCPPFTAKLKIFFDVARECFGRTAVQVIFVSGDRSSADMLEYFGRHHGDWFAIPYEQRQLKELLNRRFVVGGIPSIRVLDDHGNAVACFDEDGTHDFGEAIRHMPKSNPEYYVRDLYKKLKDHIPSDNNGFLPPAERDTIKEAMTREIEGHGNLVGRVKDLQSGDFHHAARGLRHYLQVADDWNEATECTEDGMESEVARLRDCPHCASRQAQVLGEMGRSAEAEDTRQLAAALTKLRETEATAHQARLDRLAQNKHSRLHPASTTSNASSADDDAALDPVASCVAAEQAVQDVRAEVEAIREKMRSQGFWFYGCEQTAPQPAATMEVFEVGPIWNNVEAADKANAWIEANKPGEGYAFTGEWWSVVQDRTSFCQFTKRAAPTPSPSWPHEHVQKPYGEFCQPLCQSCDDYRLDYTTIASHLQYVLHEAASEENILNDVRDKGRSGMRLTDFALAPEAQDAQLSREEVASLRFYTSNSFGAINTALRDHRRDCAHPLPAITTNIQEGIKKLRTIGANDPAARQELILWRGFKDMQVTEEFNEAGGTELAPMSTTTDLGVAVGYAAESDQSGSALLFRIVTDNNLQRGAGLSVRGTTVLLSCYPRYIGILMAFFTNAQTTWYVHDIVTMLCCRCSGCRCLRARLRFCFRRSRTSKRLAGHRR